MDEQLKHRLVGAAVIILLAVLIVPMFFEDKTPKDPATLPDAIQEKALELPADTRDAPEESAKPQPSKEPAAKAQVKSQKYEVVSLDETPPGKPPRTGTQPAPDQSALDSHVPESPVESAAIPDDTIGVDRPSPRIAPKSPAGKLKTNVGASPGETADVRGVSGSKYKLKSTTEVPPTPAGTAITTRKNTPAAAGTKPGAVGLPAPATRNTASPVARSGELPPKKPSVSATDNSAKASKKTSTAAAVAPKKAQASSASGGRWTVQAGTFADESNARKLVEKLQKRNLPVRIHAAEGSSGKVYRVTVGPSLDRDRAEQIQKQLSSQDGVKGMILQSR